MRKRTAPQSIKKQQGFTLLELLVVVSVLATLAGITAVAMDGYEQEAQEQLVDVEMQRVVSAIYRFKEDTGYFPKEGIFAADALYGGDAGTEKSQYNHEENLAWLFNPPEVHDTDGDGDVDAGDTDPFSRLPWNINSGRGWHGPYLTLESQQSLSSNDCDLPAVGTDDIYAGLTDTFERNTAYDDSSVCALVLSGGAWVPREFSGIPYRYETTYTNANIEGCNTVAGCVALISAGADSAFGSGDDVVSVIRVN